jgi:NAD(P)-dependent dehydrogenase (short-subunit alcohol dehydrogenase family)
MPGNKVGAGFNRLAGRRVLITGAAQGIGRAIAEVFVREGAKVALLDLPGDGLNEACATLGGIACPLDLTQAEQIAPTVEHAVKQLGGLDGLVNCAGIGIPKPIEETDLALLGRFLAINLTAPYMLCRAALPHLRKVKGSTIVNIASGIALHPAIPNNTAYAASKGGLLTFSKALAVEVASADVRVNVVCPGITRTPMTEFLVGRYKDNPAEAPFLQHYPMKRVAEGEDMANAVLFLSSNESAFITGTAMAVDGGRCLH